MSHITQDGMIDVCARYSGAKYYVGELIPERKLANASKSMNIPPDEHVIALIDATVFGSSKEGMAIGMSGIYWKNINAWATVNNYLSWDEFKAADVQKIDKSSVSLGQGNVFYTGFAIEMNDLLELLTRLRAYVANEDIVDQQAAVSAPTAAPEPPSETPALVWMVAVAGKQYGPYELIMLKELIDRGQIRIEEAYVWKPGMPSWVPMLQQPEVAALVIPPVPEAEGVDVNTASYDELVERLGMGAIDAKRIVQLRESTGGFESAEQLGELLGYKPHRVEQLRKRAVFTPVVSKPNGDGKSARVIDY